MHLGSGRMVSSCFVCDNFVGDKDVPDLFAEYRNIDDQIARLLSEIVDKPVSNENIFSHILCMTCYVACLEYDKFKKQIQQIKTELTNKFKITLPKHGLDYSVYPNKPSPVVIKKKVVLPASKLQPLPPNYVIDVSKLPKNMNVQSSPTINLKVTVGSTVLTQSLPTKPLTTSLTTIATDKAVESNIANSLSSILGMKTSTSVTSSTSMLTFNVNSLPKDFLTNNNKAVLKDEVDGEQEEDDDDDDDDLNNDEQPMEIDEDCTITKIQSKDVQEKDSDNDTNDTNDKDTEEPYFDVSLLPINDATDNETILGKLEILDASKVGNLDESENEVEEITMTESGSVISFVVSGKKLVYENGTLTVAEDDDDGDDTNDENDESQIELQVSGDEETANAIIAAAKEQGGAIIKVETGEMFRVKSVKSETEDSYKIQNMVEMERDQYKCLMCERVNESDPLLPKKKSKLYSADEIMQHLKNVHDARLYICSSCKKIMRKRSEYFAHTKECYKTVEGGQKKRVKVVAPSDTRKLHECRQCKKRFTSKTLLEEHFNVHNGARPYSCGTCGKTFASKYTHQAHLKTHLERPRPFKCQKCPKSFLTQQNLNQHEKTHLGIKDFICNICDKAFSTQHNLDVHGVVHSKDKPFVCGVCGKPFARRAEVKDHMRIHTGERPFACDICGATFTQRSNLNSHRRATHMDDKRYECTQCPKRFKRRRLLEYHNAVSHTGERPLQCEVCRARFVYPEHFKKHQRIHSGEKPFVCEVCGKSFNSRDNRNTHRFTHSDKKPYECLVCSAGFMRKQLLYQHMNTSGHLAESIVVNQPRVQKIVTEKLFPTEASEELELPESGTNSQEVVVSEEQTPSKFILSDGKTELNLVQDPDDPALLTFIQNFEGNKADGSFQSITAEQLGDQVQMVTTDETGAIRVVQLQIGANSSGWTVT